MSLFRQILLLCLVLLALPASVSAQEPPPALVVLLRDAAGAGVANAAVTVVDRSGGTILARATTNAAGEAAIGPLPVLEVRVRVAGRRTGGPALHLPGADAAGIAVVLGAPPTRLELRSEQDGTVRPDPAAELSLEAGVPADSAASLDGALLPTALSAPAVLGTLTPSPPPLIADAPQATTPAPAIWPLVVLLLLLLLAIGIVLLRIGREVAP